MYSPLQQFETRFSSPLPSSLTPLWHQFSPLLSLLSHSPMESVLSSPLLSHSPMESVLFSPLLSHSPMESVLSSPLLSHSPMESVLSSPLLSHSPMESVLSSPLLSHSPMAPVPSSPLPPFSLPYGTSSLLSSPLLSHSSPLHIVETHQHGVPSLLFLLLLLLPLFLLLSQPPCLERPVRALLSNVVCSDRICLYGNSMAQTALITWHRQH